MFLLLVILLVSSAFGNLYDSNRVVELTDKNFDQLVTNSNKVWMVEFFVPWCKHCKALAPEYAKVASALKGIVRVGAVNAEEHELLASRFQVESYPTIKMFGDDKEHPSEYDGERTADSMVESVMKITNEMVTRNLKKRFADDDNVVTLTDSNFDRLITDSKEVWMVNFYAPWCPHCKHLAPHWSSAATELQGKVKFGSLDATANKASATKYGIQGYPTIKMFKPQGEIVAYDGSRTLSDIVHWVSSHAGTQMLPGEVKQIVSKDMFKRSCEDKQLCVVSILPSMRDCTHSCRTKYLGELKQAGEKFKEQIWGWMWTEIGHQKELESAFGMDGYGSPALVVLNPKKMKYSVLKGPFTKDSIEEFLDNILKGRANGSIINEEDRSLNIVTVAPWDVSGSDSGPDKSKSKGKSRKVARNGEMETGDGEDGTKKKQIEINTTLDSETLGKDEL